MAQDISVIIPIGRNTVICDDNDSSYPNCSDYTFIRFRNTGDSLSSCSTGAGPIINGSLYGGLKDFDPIIVSISTLSRVYVSNWQGITQCSSNLSLEATADLLVSLIPPAPSGTLNISQNGTYDVSSYASAEVDVPPVMGDYHDDLVAGVNALYVLAGTILVVYFFYCIYRMFFRSLGGRE